MFRILIIVVLLLPLLVSAQGNLEVGLHAGVARFEGNQKNPNGKTVHPAFGLSVGKFLFPSWAVRWEGTLSKLSGEGADLNNKKDPDWITPIDYSFKTPLIESSFRMEWYPLGGQRYGITEESDAYYDDKAIRRFRGNTISPYVFGGIGISVVNTSLEDVTTGTGFIKQEGTKSFHTFTFGGGIRLLTASRVSLALELGLFLPGTDYFKDKTLSGYKDDDYDWYSTGLLKANYRLIDNDADNDHVTDTYDACPDIRGTKESGGCPDSDFDGVSDYFDPCPTVKGDNNGCPGGSGTTDTKNLVIHFRHNSYKLSVPSKTKLDNFVSGIVSKSGNPVTLTAISETKDGSRLLAEARLTACRFYLASREVETIVVNTSMDKDTYKEAEGKDSVILQMK